VTTKRPTHVRLEKQMTAIRRDWLDGMSIRRLALRYAMPAHLIEFILRMSSRIKPL
jgi:hypothetical protein